MKRPLPGSASSSISCGSISIAFGLLGALVAYGIMRFADTPWFDPTAFYVGVGVAAFLGAVAVWGVERLGTVPVLSKLRFCLVPIAGALVGMVVQAVPLRTPIHYDVSATSLTKAEPITWVLVGAPLGAIPAIAVMALLYLCLRLSGGRVPALDARERMIVPVAGTCLVLGTGSLSVASRVEVPVILLVLVLAIATLGEVVVRDLVRARWLGRAFRGVGSFMIVPRRELPWSGDLPAFIGGASATAAVVKVYGETGYRAAAREPIASTCDVEESALRPLRQRRALAGAFVGVASIVGLTLALWDATLM